MIGLAIALLVLIFVAMIMGAAMGRQINYARGFEAGADHAARVIRASVIDRGNR